MPPKRKASKGVEAYLQPPLLTRRAAAKQTQEQLLEASSQNASVGKNNYLKVIVVLDNNGRTMDRYAEESLMAFVDFSQQDSQTFLRSARGSGPSRNAVKMEDAIEGKVDDTDLALMFFEEVFWHSIGPSSAAVPTRSIQAAVFKCLKESRSVELAVKSFRLLSEFRKTFPCIRTRETSSSGVLELVLNVKAWTPFQSSERKDCFSEKTFTSGGMEEDPSHQAARAVLLSDHMTDEHLNWHELFRRIANCMEAYGGISSLKEKDRTAKIDKNDLMEYELELGAFLTFEYVVDILEMDFNCRLIHFEANHELEVLQCSYVRKLFKGSSRNAARELVGHLLRIICACGRRSGGKIGSLPCVSVRHICELARRLIIMFTKLGDCEHGVQRSNLKEIVDDFPDDAEMLNSFLQSIQDSRHKMDFILRQLAKKWPKVSQVQVNHGLADLFGLLECLANKAQAKLVCRAFGAETLEVLLGHAFQATIFLQEFGSAKSINDLCLALQAAIETHRAHQKLNLDELHPTVTFALILARSVCK